MQKKNKKKHVLFIIENQSLPYDARVWKEALYVKEMGYHVTAISPQNALGPDKHVKVDDIDIYRHPRPIEASGKLAFLIEYGNAIFWEFFLALKIFLRKRFHVIHAGNPPDHVFLIALFFKMFGVKFIFDHHDLCPENYIVKFGRKNFLHRLLVATEKLSFKTADVVVSTNESYKKIAVKRGGKDPSRVFVVRNGPDLSNIEFVAPNPKLKNGFDYVVAYVGVMNKEEGIENLLAAVKRIVFEKKVENIRFILVGTGSEWNRMVKESRRMGIDKWTTFTGLIPYRELYEILATADLGVNPEYANEFTDKSTMLKIMDYMTFGKPIVMFRTREGEVTAREAGVYIEGNSDAKLADGIIQLLRDQKKRTRMGEFARNRVLQELCWDKQKAGLLRAYQALGDL